MDMSTMPDRDPLRAKGAWKELTSPKGGGKAAGSCL